MARRTSVVSVMNQIAREQARARREEDARRKAANREEERRRRELLRQQMLDVKEAKILHIERRLQEVEDRNTELQEKLSGLQGILQFTFSVDDAISFENLLKSDDFPTFTPPDDIAFPLVPPIEQDFVLKVKQLNALERLIPGSTSRYEKAVATARVEFQLAYQNYLNDEKHRRKILNDLIEEHDAKRSLHLQDVHNWNQKIQDFQKSYAEGDPDSVISYNVMVLERSEYPEGFPHEFKIAYEPESKELVLEYELPGVEIVPSVAEYKYTKSKDLVEEKLRKQSEVKEIYQDIVASVALRTIHEVFEADQGNHAQVVVFNGFVQAVDPATGKNIRPCLISVRTVKERFLDIDLSRIDKKACLRNLGAQVSPRASEMQAVKPIVEFDMVDKRFVEESDVISDLESRPNLMDLTPFEFENLVSNLFNRMGLDTKQTRSSQDGGVDAIAFDMRPILGGKVIIQAKRYKNVVGVSAVRDLYGTMMNEGANKGILVATSHYGADAYEFAKDKPIELIDGGGLLYLLEQSGVKARIIFPEG